MYYGKHLNIKHFQGELGMILAEGTADDRGCHYVYIQTKNRIRVSQLAAAIVEFNRLNPADNAMNLQGLFGHPTIITTKMKRISNPIHDRIVTDAPKNNSATAQGKHHWKWRCDDDQGNDAQRRDLERLEQDIRIQDQVMAENPDAFRIIEDRRRRAESSASPEGRNARQRTEEPPLPSAPEGSSTAIASSELGSVGQQLEQMRSELEAERAATAEHAAAVHSLRTEFEQMRAELEAERAACAELKKFKTKHAASKNLYDRVCKDVGAFLVILKMTYPANTFKGDEATSHSRHAPQPPPELPLTQETIDSIETMPPEELKRLIRRQFYEGKRWQKSYSRRDQTTLKLAARLVELEEQLTNTPVQQPN